MHELSWVNVWVNYVALSFSFYALHFTASPVLIFSRDYRRTPDLDASFKAKQSISHNPLMWNKQTGICQGGPSVEGREFRDRRRANLVKPGTM